MVCKGLESLALAGLCIVAVACDEHEAGQAGERRDEGLAEVALDDGGAQGEGTHALAESALAERCAADGLDVCGDGCVDLAVDPRHCGACGRACAGACVAGYCEPACRPGEVRCGGKCVARPLAQARGPRTRTFTFTGGPQTFVVPDCVDRITVELWGAQGGGSRCCEYTGGELQEDGGLGAYVRAALAVVPGEVLQIEVGGQGGRDGAPGYNGGGPGGEFAGGGGGASDIRRGTTLAERLLVAGGGGGGQCGCPDHGAGGPGGTLVGGPGESFYPEWEAAGGGTQSAGGAAGTAPGMPGAFGLGGGAPLYHVAGGGGGWYGGGSAFAAGGGGGSSRTIDGPTSQATPGVRAGDGLVRVSW